MILHLPAMITSRLLPGVAVGDDSTISITYLDDGLEGRTRYVYYIDGPDFEHSGSLKSEWRYGTLQDGLVSLLSFLGAASEAYGTVNNTGAESDNADLFPPEVMAWAYEHDDELAMLQYDLETGEYIIED